MNSTYFEPIADPIISGETLQNDETDEPPEEEAPKTPQTLTRPVPAKRTLKKEDREPESPYFELENQPELSSVTDAE